MDLPYLLQDALGSAYTIEQELPSGGMSRVFLARDAMLGRKVVVKTLSTELQGTLSAERFRREIRLVASLQQANIVPILSAGEADGNPYYTMPFVEGENLRAHLHQRGPLPLTQVANVLRDVARALAFAHERSIIHRDIKPDNILLSGSTAVVTDFGVAKALEASRTADATTLTHLGAVIGTPQYMAPEQATGDADVDHRADIYALGIVAYELLTGAPPFTATSAQAMLAAQVTSRPADIRERRPDVESAFAQLVMSCLEKDPANRPQTAHDVLRALDRVERTPTPGPSPQAAPVAGAKPMIVVLPFANLSPATDDEYFSDGITEDIIAQLSQVGSLRVISRTSAMRYKKSELGVKEIASSVGATHVVEGSVRRAGHRLRIVAQLVDAATDAHLWAQTFDRELTDVFAVQTEVAERIADALRARLDADERRRIAKRPTDDQQAYNLYLLARHHANLVTADSLARATEFYQQAVARDPKFARAWAALAASHQFHLAGYYGVRPRDAGAKIIEWATRALELDNDIAEAHSALAMVAYILHFDWETARLRLDRALHLGPNLAPVHLQFGNYLVGAGRYSEAVDEARQALELDPASEYVHVHANFLRYMTRHFDEALSGLAAAEAEFGRKVLPLTRGETLIAVGRAAEAVDSFRELYERIPIAWNLGHLAWSLAAASKEHECRAALRDLHEREQREYVWPLAIALSYGHLGEMDVAFRYLKQSYEDRVAWIQWPHAPTFDVFRGDRRFDSMLRRVGAAPPRQ